MELHVVAMETRFPEAYYLWSDGTEVMKNLETGKWTSHQIPHPLLQPSVFAPRVRATDSLNLELAPEVQVDE